MLEKSKRIFRRFISSRWFPLAVACAALLAVLVVAFLLGFRITYAPELENSWEAISAVASWASVAVSAVAVWAAVQIPKKIADQQNKIALVNSRLEIIDLIEKIASTISMIHNISTRNNNSLSRDALLELLPFASLDEFNKNLGVITRYSIYFSEFQEPVKDLLILYAYMTLKCYQLEREKESNTIVEETLESINEANEFIRSEEFYQLKNYMNNAGKLDK